MKTNGRKGRRVRPYTTGEAAAELGLSRRKVIRLCDAGLIGHFWTSEGGQRRIPVSALKKYQRQES